MSTRNRSAGRTLVAGMAAVATALTLAAGASPGAKSALGVLQLQATFPTAWQFGPFCPPATPAGVECVRFVGSADVPGLGKAASTYVKTLFEADGCPTDMPVRQFSRAVIEVIGRGTIELTLPGNVCGVPAPADIGPLVLTITGGTGLYAGASGSVEFRSSVHEPRSRCGANLCGSASDTWTGTLSVPGHEFDLTPPAIRGAVSKAVRATRRAKRVRVRYAVSAQDAVDGSLPAACGPRSGSFFKVGRTTVTCSATDSSANTRRARFTVTVRRARG